VLVPDLSLKFFPYVSTYLSLLLDTLANINKGWIGFRHSLRTCSWRRDGSGSVCNPPKSLWERGHPAFELQSWLPIHAAVWAWPGPCEGLFASLFVLV